MQLYNYFRSSASFRVRIALNLKGLSYDYSAIGLLKQEQFSENFRKISPDALVPVLIDGPAALIQSLAICEYLEETHPEPSLLPGGALERARIRALALTIACETHPLNNLRVLRYLVHEFKVSDDAKDAWYRHWVENGLLAYENQLSGYDSHGLFSVGDIPTLADVFLVPQIFNARRVNTDFSKVPRVMEIFENCMALPAFEAARPEHQPDAA